MCADVCFDRANSRGLKLGPLENSEQQPTEYKKKIQYEMLQRQQTQIKIPQKWKEKERNRWYTTAYSVD